MQQIQNTTNNPATPPDRLLTSAQVGYVRRKVLEHVDFMIDEEGTIFAAYGYFGWDGPRGRVHLDHLREIINDECEGVRHFPLSETNWAVVAKAFPRHARPSFAIRRDPVLYPRRDDRLYQDHEREIQRSSALLTLFEWMRTRPTWQGTCSELMELLKKEATPHRLQNRWPYTPRHLSDLLTRQAEALQTFGIQVGRSGRKIELFNTWYYLEKSAQ